MVEHPRIRMKKTNTESLHDFICIILLVGLLLDLASIWPYLPEHLTRECRSMANRMNS